MSWYDRGRRARRRRLRRRDQPRRDGPHRSRPGPHREARDFPCLGEGAGMVAATLRGGDAPGRRAASRL